jgi:hypothetical protein
MPRNKRRLARSGLGVQHQQTVLRQLCGDLAEAGVNRQGGYFMLGRWFHTFILNRFR